MKRVRSVEIVTQVRQVIEVIDITVTNALLTSGDWVLLNTYYNSAFTTKKPTFVLGRLKEY